MKKMIAQNKNEIKFIIISFSILIVLMIGVKIFDNYETNVIHTTTLNIYDYPLQVSNAAVDLEKEIYKIHRDMKDIVLSQSIEELNKRIQNVDRQEGLIYKDLSIIKKRILGDSGLKLQDQMLMLFKEWRPIRDEAIALKRDNNAMAAIAITKGKGAQHILKMEKISHKLYLYAINKAEEFKEKSISKSEALKKLIILVDIVSLIIFILIVYYTISRISKHINRNSHLNSVLTVIRDIDQLIVRENDLDTLLQESCNILSSSHIYGHTWMITFDENNKVDRIIGTDDSEDFRVFKDKIKHGWNPYCIDKIMHSEKHYSNIRNTEQTCLACPQKDAYHTNSAFTIEIKHNSKLYGYLNIPMAQEYTSNKNELELLEEVAKDLAYAIHTIGLAKELEKSENTYRTLFQGNRTVELIIDPSNGQIVDANNKAYEYYGYSHEELMQMKISDINILSKEEIELEIQRAKNEVSDKFEFKHKLANGDIRDVEVYSGPVVIDDTVLIYSIVFDITDTKLKELALKESEEKFRAIFEQSGGYSMILDPNTSDGIPIIVDANEAAYKMHGYSKEEFIGRPVADIDDEEGKSLTKKRTAKIMTGKPFYVENTHIRQDGTTFDVAVNANRIDIGDKAPLIFTTEYDISKLKQAEKELKQSEERLNLIINKSPIGICTVDLYGNFVLTNSTYEKMLGYSKKELSELSFFDITHPDYRPENKALFQKMFSLKETGFDIEKVYICKDNKEIDVSVHATGISDETGKVKFGTAFIEDITEKKRNHRLLEQKKNEFETIIKEAPNPIMIHNEEGEVLMVNKVWEALTGYKYKEIDTISKWTQKAYGERMPVVKAYIDKLYKFNHQHDDREFDIITKEGNTIIWQFGSAPLGIIDGKRTIISSAMDITELKHKDEMLIDQSRHAAMGEMIGMIAHQWRQPLSTISMDANNMLLDISLGELSTTASEEYAKSISDQTQHLSQTIDDFRNFFKPDRVISKVNIKDILDQTLVIVKDSLTNNTITLTSSFETEQEVDAYPRELMQVFVNIIINAKDALVHNKTKNAQINIRVYEDEKYINTEICDNGGGIASDILPKIFDPYFTTTGEKNGTGLGLYMSKMIIEDHLNGILEVKNKEYGACFTVRLLKEQWIKEIDMNNFKEI